MRLHYLQHVPFEAPGAILEWALARNFDIDATRLHEGESLPAHADYDALVIMGGPMNVYEFDAHPWLREEQVFIREAIAAGRHVLGICLGAQLIACASGARVTRNPEPEIGWFPVRETADCARSPYAGFLGGSLDVLHWHGDTCALPPGATHLATSAACAQQAYCIGPRVLGLQFHLELRENDLDTLLRHAGGDLVPRPWVQDAATIRAGGARCAATRAALEALLSRWLDRP